MWLFVRPDVSNVTCGPAQPRIAALGFGVGFGVGASERRSAAKSGFAPVLGIEDRKRFVDDVGAPPPASDRAHREFRELGLRAASSHKYKLKAGRTPSRYTVRINLYVDTRAAADGWERRYPPEERERGAALSLGDQGFQLDGWIRAFRVGRALIEIEGGGEAAPIDAFAAAYARHVETLRMRLQ